MARISTHEYLVFGSHHHQIVQLKVKESSEKISDDSYCVIQDYEDVKVRIVNILTLSILSVLSFIIEAWANLSNIALKIFLL